MDALPLHKGKARRRDGNDEDSEQMIRKTRRLEIRKYLPYFLRV
jgi:hypothetical protein